jgi:hypothetical protein
MDTLHYPVVDTLDVRKALVNLTRSLQRLHQALVRVSQPPAALFRKRGNDVAAALPKLISQPQSGRASHP